MESSETPKQTPGSLPLPKPPLAQDEELKHDYIDQPSLCPQQEEHFFESQHLANPCQEPLIEKQDSASSASESAINLHNQLIQQIAKRQSA